MKLAQTFNSYSGSGVKIYVADDGLYHTHPDIAANYSGGYNFCNGQNVPTPMGNHGTMVTGLIAAVGKNGIGVSGISYASKVFVNNIVSNCQASNRWVEAILTQVQGHHVWSGSFGYASTSGFQTRTANLPHYDSYVTGANNYNIIYQKANGNDGPSGNGNADPSGSVHTIAHIGALNNRRAPASYTSLVQIFLCQTMLVEMQAVQREFVQSLKEVHIHVQ
jgi:subtilisin family serine protease